MYTQKPISSRLTQFDYKLTFVKQTGANDSYIESPSFSDTSEQRIHSSSESSYNQSDVASSTTALYFPTSTSVRTSDYIEERDSPLILDSSHHCSLNSYYNLRTKRRQLPPIPRSQLPITPEAVSLRKDYCSSCACQDHYQQIYPSCITRSCCLLPLTVIALTLSLVSCIVVGLSFWKRQEPVWQNAIFKEGDYQTCIPCVQLPDDDEVSAVLKNQLNATRTVNDTLCCARTSGQMSALMQLIISQKKNKTVYEPPSKHKFRFSPVSAHKQLHPWKLTDRDETAFANKSYQLNISPNIDTNTEHVQHVEATNNSLQVMFSGLYLVYSSVYFKPTTEKPCRLLRYQVWGHFIKRCNPSKVSSSGILVQSAHTCCDSCTEDHHTSYAAGVFMLEAGDNIFVDVSGSGLVLFDGEASYLGLVMLGSRDYAINTD